MKSVAVPLVLAAALFIVQAWLRPASAGATPSVAAASSRSILAGAVAPVFVALTWVEAEAALEQGRVHDALDCLRRLEAADPAGFEASVFRAHLTSHNLADRELPEARAARIVEAVHILAAAAGRTSDPGPHVALGQLLLEPRMWDPDLSGRISRALGRSPREEALAALDEATRRAPGSPEIALLLMEGARLAGVESVAAGAAIAIARDRLDRAEAAGARIPGKSLARDLTLGWAACVRAAAGGGADEIDEAGRAFGAALRAWDAVAPLGDASEAVYAAALARRLAGLAEDRLRAGDAAAALSLAAQIPMIRTLVADRLDRSDPRLLGSVTDRRRVERLLDEIGRNRPDLEARTAEVRSHISAW